ncbi:MAG: polysaccharide deacetylase family protein [Methylacidiphilales bacterium]|nr:polysaccharide deacetylase family protein [Candidatus Methylacidiphilales bacterium]
MKHLIVSLHDLHPGSLDAVRGQIDCLKTLGISNFSILAVPHFHHQKRLKDHAGMLKFLDERSQAGDDLVIHGFYHDRSDRGGGPLFWTKFYTANEAEFLDLSDGEARHRVETALEIWREHGWPANGFIAPAWLLPRAQDVLLKRMGFSYTTRLGGIHLLRKGMEMASQSLCYSTRAEWRRKISLLWNPFLFKRLVGRQVVRLSLHPDDLNHPPIREQILEIAGMALAAGYEPVTYSAYAEM